jgi:rhamnogalacturonan acetylesterase
MFNALRHWPVCYVAFTLALASWCCVAADDSPPAGEPKPDPKLPTLFLIGDSTVRNGTAGNGAGGVWGWGKPIADLFDTKWINVQNRAWGGTSSRSFLASGRWEKVLGDVKPGDFVIMQFGHNDNGSVGNDPRARATLRGNGEETQEVTLPSGEKEFVHTFGWYLRKYIADTKAKGATPIVCSLIPRNDWSGGKVIRSVNSHGQWAREAAQAGGTQFIDLNSFVAARYDQLGQDKVTKEFFVSEHTHTSWEGAKLNAQCVVDGLRALPGCKLKDFLRPAAMTHEASRTKSP